MALHDEAVTAGEETHTNAVRTDQQFSDAQLSILRQAAAILGVPTTGLAAALIGRDRPLNMAEGYAQASRLPAKAHSTNDTDEGTHFSQWSSDLPVVYSDSVPELDQTSEQHFGLVVPDLRSSCAYQDPGRFENWHQVSREGLQNSIPSDARPRFRNTDLQVQHGTSSNLNFGQLPYRSSLFGDKSHTFPALTQLGSQDRNIGDVFDGNAFRGSGGNALMYDFNAALEFSNSYAEVLGPAGSSNTLYTAVNTDGLGDDVYGSSGNDSIQSVEGFPTSLRPDTSYTTIGPVEGDPSSSGSSWVVVAPPSDKGQSSDSSILSSNQETPTVFGYIDSCLGPCSRTWEVVRRAAKRDANFAQRQKKRHRAIVNATSESQRQRRPFYDRQMREATALTRQLKACIRCRMQRIRCEADPIDLRGPCLTCIRHYGSTLSRLPCIRYNVADVPLYEQSAPNPLWTQRWKTMVVQNVTGWASQTVRTIKVTQGFGNATYELEVKKFLPQEGDLLEKIWSDGGSMKSYRVPPYAIVDMEKAARVQAKYVDENIPTHIRDGVDRSEPLIWNTYVMAFKRSQEAPRNEERILLTNTLRVWVAARMFSKTEWLCGDDTLDMMPVVDPSSPYFGRLPIPPVMSAQIQIIGYSKIVRPLKKIVLDQLHALILANQRRNWLTIYLTLFVLLHSCSMMTRRNEEYARQLNLETRYANPQSISQFHKGALVLLAHFHYCNKGKRPFALADNSTHLEELAKAAELNPEEVRFMKNTSILVQQRRKLMMRAREGLVFDNEYYFISQLYDDEWKPTPTA